MDAISSQAPALCELYANLYSTRTTPVGTWDKVIPTDGSYCAVKSIKGVPHIFWRGSTTPLDWLRDFKLASVPIYDDKLGWIHPGFHEDVGKVFDQIEALVGDRPVVVLGHSKGAGDGQNYAARRVVSDKPVSELIFWGTPRAGGPKLGQILSHIPATLYRNQNLKDPDLIDHDLVTDVSFLEPYDNIREMTDLLVSPDITDPWGPLRYHHYYLYCVGINATGPAISALPKN